MKTPSFWNSDNFLSDLLSPLGRMYALATGLRLRFKKSRKAACPVICVGNLTAGGTGKTPEKTACFLRKGKSSAPRTAAAKHYRFRRHRPPAEILQLVKRTRLYPDKNL